MFYRSKYLVLNLLRKELKLKRPATGSVTGLKPQLSWESYNILTLHASMKALQNSNKICLKWQWSIQSLREKELFQCWISQHIWSAHSKSFRARDIHGLMTHCAESNVKGGIVAREKHIMDTVWGRQKIRKLFIKTLLNFHLRRRNQK